MTCDCGAHRLHRVWQFAWSNPSASRKDAAKALKLSYANVREAFHELRKRDLTRMCPECGRLQLFDGVCHGCGFEPAAPVLPIEVRADNQYPTNWLHAGNLLGSETDYDAIGFASSGLVLKRRVERGIEDPLIRGVKSDIENELKRSYPSEAITDEAGRLAVKEVIEFRSKYPGLATSKNVRRELVRNTMNRLKLLHPQLRNVSVLASEVVA